MPVTRKNGRMLQVIAIPALKDNYIWAIIGGDHCVVVDPGEAAPILSCLHKKKLQLSAILITHHHGDHIGGVPELLRHAAVPVYGPASEDIATVDHPISEGDRIELSDIGAGFDVLKLPGHTLGHIAYYGEGMLFCGDTLFACGCGRIFEGTPEQMYDSLQRLAALPPETHVYCTHEYTLSNIDFALSVEPENRSLQARQQAELAKRQHNQPTLPSTIALELATNPFLRSHSAAIREAAEAYAQHPLTNLQSVFTVVRAMKNHF